AACLVAELPRGEPDPGERLGGQVEARVVVPRASLEEPVDPGCVAVVQDAKRFRVVLCVGEESCVAPRVRRFHVDVPPWLYALKKRRRRPNVSGRSSCRCEWLHCAAMSKVCAVCGKKPSFGHNRSHSMVATKRRFE